MQIESTNIILYCKKWAETVDFYRRGLGLPVRSGSDWFVEFDLTPAARLSVADAARATVKSGGGQGVTIGLQVADSAAAREQCAAAGLAPTALKRVWGADAFYLFDPEGNRVEVWSGQAKA